MVNNLYKQTSLQTTFPCNMVALVEKTPQTLNLKQFLEHFLAFRSALPLSCLVCRRGQGGEGGGGGGGGREGGGGGGC